MDVWVSVALAMLGVVVPVIAALYEFVFKGLKRLGYRVQMDTTATDVVHTNYAGALEQMQQDGRPLADPTLVLLRIENNGLTNVDTSDYATRDHDPVGIRVRFPGRKVAGMVITELSHDFLHSSFREGPGLSVQDGMVELPKAPLNRGQHYKVLAVLEKGPDHVGKPGVYEDPEVIGGIKGGVGGGRINETQSRTGTRKSVIALIAFLMVLSVGQLVVFLRSNTSAPLDCAGGRLTLVGSTAAEPVLREAADTYAKTCSGARFTLDLNGSGDGIRTLHQSPSPDTVAFSDGPKPGGNPSLVARPLALFLFTVVVNPRAGVNDLDRSEIRDIYAGKYSNWKEIGGKDVPIRLISRNPQSGTRITFQKQVLDGVREAGTNSDDCLALAAGTRPGVVRCERRSTTDVLRSVADTPGGLGYSELGAAGRRPDVTKVSIGGHKATAESADSGAYPFWETEFAYTSGDPAATSLAASFLRYLTNQVGADILRTHGNRPCYELQNPALCRPVAAEGNRQGE
ncbi:substrate-binding domain-containing protein [Actinoplanes sp. NPDC051633]|uniref:PstS family phosphate ABC transporter substrate-binding protein n=1 Tax=Actinoplanes sp. NPDC051633 TaxID=3155670 RepID=UPI003441809D